MRSKQYPFATIGILVATGVLTSLQFAFPGIVPLLERTPTAIKHHQWWRLVTPLFVHPEGWRQIAFNFSSILVLGALVERLLGPWRWLLLYFVSGVIGEVAGYLWQPVGAGASVAGSGLLGALALWLTFKNRSTQAAIGGVIILMGGTILITVRDIHGPPIMAGAFIGWAMLKTKRTEDKLQLQSESPSDEHTLTTTDNH